MKKFRGWMLPDGEQHLIDWMTGVGHEVDGRLTYQYSKLDAAMSLVTLFRRSVDVGSHIGLWGFYLAKKFSRVECFEPVELHRQCFVKNVEADTVILHPFALGDWNTKVSLHTGPASSGDTYVQKGGEHKAEMRTLDSFGLTEVDFLKIDVEGYELFVIRGGEKTIRTCKPCIVVEQKPGHGAKFGIGDKDALPLLESWGYKVRQEISGDFILTSR